MNQSISICHVPSAGRWEMEDGKWKMEKAGFSRPVNQSALRKEKLTMPKYERFEDLPAWKEAAKLYNQVLDLFEQQNVKLSLGFRDQLDRAALSISNNISEGFERITTNELLSFLDIAKGSAGEVRSIISVVIDREGYRSCRGQFLVIQATAQSCCRQLGAWISALQNVPSQRKRRLDGSQREFLETRRKTAEFRRQFLRNLKPEHPLYHCPEAQAARGEQS